MNLKVPIYVEQQPPGDAASMYRVRPLFFEEPEARDEELSRAIAKFVRVLRKHLSVFGAERRQDPIAPYGFAPEIEEHTLTLSFDLKENKGSGKFLFVVFHALERRIAFTPSIPGLWFEIGRGEGLRDRAQEVLTEFFRESGARSGYRLKPADVGLKGKAETGFVDIEISPASLAKAPKSEFRAGLFAQEEMDGVWELQKVGRCLNELYPGELTRANGREAELAELSRLLKRSSHRPVLLVGPRQVGKTALIEEYVFRKTARRGSAYASKRNLWLLSPQRLISGMSYVGQWENRLLAILKTAKKQEHILYFDDLLGLFKAGVSATSNLNAAMVLKPFIERREIRIVGEITPEALRVLREQDRGFADLFHLLPVPEASEDETFRMMIGLSRQLEDQYRCRFRVEVLPRVMNLQRRYVRDAAFPGKVAGFLRQLAVKYRGQEIHEDAVLDEFRARTGLSMSFLTDEGIDALEIESQLSQKVMGQPEAVQACAGALITARARLNDTDRPLACFLFLGPTGVGKTECAKSLAQLLFGSEDRVLRFDMNEFLTYDSVARLVGTFDRPEGLLTSAIRRQPFSILLLDEIEKAHRDAFNLLLQVMGEGRLTDALGRTADFTNAIVILTSNLGAKEAASRLGFGNAAASETSIYTQAAEKFFSPEFFNRLDRVVPFQRLNRETISRIANVLIWKVLHREGLIRRRGVMRTDPLAMRRIVDAGYHPLLGARALKRTLERELAQPIAARFSAMSWSTPIVIDVLPGAERLQIRVQEIVDTDARTAPLTEALLDEPHETLARLDAFLTRADETLERLRPDGPIRADAVAPHHQRYFALRERARGLRHACVGIVNAIEHEERKSTRLAAGGVRAARRRNAGKYIHEPPPRCVWRELFAAEDMHAYLRDLATIRTGERGAPQGVRHRLARAIRDSALIDMLLQGPETSTSERVLLRLRITDLYVLHFAERLASQYEEMFSQVFGLETMRLSRAPARPDRMDIWLLLSGWEAARLAAAETGTHVLIESNDHFLPVQVAALPLGASERPLDAIRTLLRRHRDWPRKLARGEAALDDDPWPMAPVVRIVAEQGCEFKTTTDLRSGLTVQGLATAEQLGEFLAASFALPPELSE